LEAFGSGQWTTALLVHHADSNSRQAFSDWLHQHSGRDAWIHGEGAEVQGTIFRVRMCFGRGLIILRSQMQFREGQRLNITLEDDIRVK
jgi:hypothetical protein